MKLLFIHQNFPGQYRDIIPRLATTGAHRIVCMGDRKNMKKQPSLQGVRFHSYPSPKRAGRRTHHYLRGLEGAIRRGQAVARACMAMRDAGFSPDVICVHPGWGEALFLKDVFPEARILVFLEFFYHAQGSDVGFDPEFPSSDDDMYRTRIKNSTILLSLDMMDRGVAPTQWQFMQHPSVYHDRISVIHDGVDTGRVRPDPQARLRIPGTDLELGPDDKVITFVNRNLEPYRGFHSFIRALPQIQRKHPDARIVIIGGDKTSYGQPPPAGTTYRQKYLQEVEGRLDLGRVHFLGRVPYDVFLSALQVSACHVYLTYPFVLSWSMLEAMAAGCALVASSTQPVTEVVRDGDNGLLVDFFSHVAIAEGVDRVLSDPGGMAAMREQARETVVRNYDLKSVCLPRHIALIEDLAAGRLSS